MPTYMLEQYEVYFVWKAHETEAFWGFYTSDNEVLIIDGGGSDMDAVTAIPSSGVPVYPWIHHTYDFDVNIPGWVLNAGRYTEALKNNMSEYRDSQLLNETMVTLTWDEGGPDEEELGLVADSRTIESVKYYSDLSMDKNVSENDFVDYKFKTFTSKGDWDIGTRLVDTAFLKEFLILLGNVRLKHFRAEAKVMFDHGVTPYTDHTFAIPESDFDDYILNN